MVSLNTLYLKIKQKLAEAGLESPAFDALCILEEGIGFRGRGHLAVHGNEKVNDHDAQRCVDMAVQRTFRPLQYVLGKWEFMGMEMKVGEGVLIPREDTVVLVESAAAFIGDGCKKVLDLCSGSGAVALGIAKACPNARVTAVEISGQAMLFLEENIKKICPERVRAVSGNILKEPDIPEKFDVIVSNPPYIPSEDIKTLDRDVRCEPLLALDGGKDGLLFYRAILKNYLSCLKEGGLLAVEIGIHQEKEICTAFQAAGLTKISVYQDINGINRVVTGVICSKAFKS